MYSKCKTELSKTKYSLFISTIVTIYIQLIVIVYTFAKTIDKVMAKTKTKSQFNVRLDDELISFLHNEGKKQNRSASNLLHTVLYDYKNSLKKPKPSPSIL